MTFFPVVPFFGGFKRETHREPKPFWGVQPQKRPAWDMGGLHIRRLAHGLPAARLSRPGLPTKP